MTNNFVPSHKIDILRGLYFVRSLALAYILLCFSWVHLRKYFQGRIEEAVLDQVSILCPWSKKIGGESRHIYDFMWELDDLNNKERSEPCSKKKAFAKKNQFGRWKILSLLHMMGTRSNHNKLEQKRGRSHPMMIPSSWMHVHATFTGCDLEGMTHIVVYNY
jgi:hypothetical protein